MTEDRTLNAIRASEIRQTWGGACPKRLKTPALND